MNKRSILGLLVLVVVAIAFFWPDPIYNDVASMQAKIAKELGRKQVSIFKVEDTDEFRFVGYSFDARYGYAVFKLNEDGNYAYDHVYKPDNLIYRAEDIGVGQHSIYWVAVSGNPALSTVKFQIEYESASKDDELVTVQIAECPSMSVIKLPEVKWSGQYTFHDSAGNLIKQR